VRPRGAATGEADKADKAVAADIAALKGRDLKRETYRAGQTWRVASVSPSPDNDGDSREASRGMLKAGARPTGLGATNQYDHPVSLAG